MQLTPSFGSLLHQYRHVFTAPTFATFLTIATGWCLSHRHRYVTEGIFATYEPAAVTYRPTTPDERAWRLSQVRAALARTG